MYISNDLTFKHHIRGKNGLLNKLNSSLFAIRRLSQKVPLNVLKRVADAICVSKIRYGMALYGQVRLKEEDPHSPLMNSIQVALNKVARIICNVKISDRISTRELSDRSGLPSINQLAAEVKLLEVR